MLFEWDEDKNAANIAKHGIGFQTACRIFEGTVVTAIDERFDYGEVRFNSIGIIAGIVFLVVTHTDREGRTRIISARPAKQKERQRYVQAIQQGTGS